MVRTACPVVNASSVCGRCKMLAAKAGTSIRPAHLLIGLPALLAPAASALVL